MLINIKLFNYLIMVKLGNKYALGKHWKWSEESRQRMRIICLGKHSSESTKEKISLANKGHIVSEETKQKISQNKERILKISLARRGTHQSEETKKKISETRKRLYKEGKIINAKKGISLSDETKQKMKLLWQNQNYRENQIKNILKGLMKRPTSLENAFLKFIQRDNLPFSYCGNGTLIIGGKCPDFYNNNGKKICIDIRPKIMCKIWNKCTPEEYERQRMEHFAKYGWKCIVIWDEDLHNEQEILEKMKGIL